MADDEGRIAGIVTADGERSGAPRVVLTTGTFLRGLIHMGEETTPAGRVGDAASYGLSATLERFGFALGRLKTGTPPRLDGRTIDWAGLEVQKGDDPPVPFSYLTERITVPQTVCHITGTTAASHDLIRANLDRAPIYSGQIEGPGRAIARRSRTRWCGSPTRPPPDLPRAGRAGRPHGLSQRHFDLAAARRAGGDAEDHSGLERAGCIRPGYAIEYDYVDPRELHRRWRPGAFPGFIFAGQINGTTGYEEAGAQGLMAGLNAALAAGGGDRSCWTGRTPISAC